MGETNVGDDVLFKNSNTLFLYYVRVRKEVNVLKSS